ncbi:hypothetical protein RJ639_029299 [Escallonia herrerae]|uniref:Photolyase/cryptochrome alpha/beta domain-containing protein n=1 Tax=Escallonia herrerae TaxID=1293975 RepID=A0AA89BEV9_9ASTE|nr:hypothetical protein RJ639_029299 [Escallonia herrerae]
MACHKVPGLSSEETDRVADQTFQRYSSSSLTKQRNGKGVAIVWFRNDLRVLDNEALFKAWISSEAVLPVYCVDPRHFGTTHKFGFPKTGAKGKEMRPERRAAGAAGAAAGATSSGSNGKGDAAGETVRERLLWRSSRARAVASKAKNLGGAVAGATRISAAMQQLRP